MFIDFRERGRERERERNINVNIYQLPLIHTPPGDQTHNLSMCPDWESNL